ncbi:hypothetical protein [Dietzia sp.]|uniref:hypothetical protein n=1 Tax=Dietzia sp. TaxID=1871616 RepID=UPI002FD9E6CB
MDDDTVDAQHWLYLDIEGADTPGLDVEGILPGADETVALRAEAERAAAAGDLRSMYRLALADDSLLRLFDSERWWALAAEHGDATAMFNLGVYAFHAHDFDDARGHWITAARHGSASAAHNLRVLEREVEQVDGRLLIRRFPPGEEPI